MCVCVLTVGVDVCVLTVVWMCVLTVGVDVCAYSRCGCVCMCVIVCTCEQTQQFNIVQYIMASS